jgi:hypothetical protein
VNNQHCPVLWGFYKQLRLKPGSSAWGEAFDLDELEEEIRRAPSSHEYSQFRAFLIVEDMLGRINELCKKLKPNFEPDLVLKPRSWERLSQIKTNLVKLQNEAELTTAEGKLEGSVIMTEGDVEIILGGANSKTDNDRLSAARLIAPLCTPTIEAVRSLRPYLRNDDAPIQNVPVLYSQFMTIHYGYNSNLFNMTKCLIGVRL